VGVQFVEDMPDVVVDSGDAEIQLSGDLLSRGAGRE
jgi:hypothetical protein